MPNPSPVSDVAYTGRLDCVSGTWAPVVSGQSLDARLQYLEQRSEFLAVGMTLQLAMLTVCVIVTVANTCCFFQHVIGKGRYGHRSA